MACRGLSSPLPQRVQGCPASPGGGIHQPPNLRTGMMGEPALSPRCQSDSLRPLDFRLLSQLGFPGFPSQGGEAHQTGPARLDWKIGYTLTWAPRSIYPPPPPPGTSESRGKAIPHWKPRLALKEEATHVPTVGRGQALPRDNGWCGSRSGRNSMLGSWGLSRMSS